MKNFPWRYSPKRILWLSFFVLALVLLPASASSLTRWPANEPDPNQRKTVQSSAAGPFRIGSHPAEHDNAIGAFAATKKPQIVPVVLGKELFIAWQSWDNSRTTDQIHVVKIAIDQLEQGKLIAVRAVPSGGTLVGFTVDSAGTDYVLTAKTEVFENQPKGDFVDAIHNQARPDVVNLFIKGEKKDLNSRQYTDLNFYGLCNGGSGRLIAGGDYLGAVFARRRFTPGDGLIHQEADSLLTTKDLSKTLVRASNTVSHSFDQRLIFDGQDFVALHQADMYPFAGLLIQKLRTGPANKATAGRYVVFASPTFQNDVYFELGGLAAEKDGYPILFTATHNTKEISDKNAVASRAVTWDLAMVFVTRDFDTRPTPANPYDIVGSGILAKGYEQPDKFTVTNFNWEPKTSTWTNPEPRTINRQVSWLTAYGEEKKETRKAACAKLTKLGEGSYVALWEEHILAGQQWQYARTWAATLTIGGKDGTKLIQRGPMAALPPLRLHRGDDPVTLTVNGAAHAAWVTAGATNSDLVLHTVNEELKYKAQTLKLP